MTMRRGARQDLMPAPLPQTEGAHAPVETQIVNGFWQFLPTAGTTFFARDYFRNYPKPLFVGKLPPFPVPLPVVKLTVPNQQAFILKEFSFQVYEQSPVGQEQLVEVSPSRVASYFGFEVKVGNRSPYDFNTNVTARGQVIDYKPPQTASIASPPVPGQSTNMPFSGVNNPVGQNFAAYAKAGELIEMTVWVLREPVFDVRMLSAYMSGYNVNHAMLYKILGRVTP